MIKQTVRGRESILPPEALALPSSLMLASSRGTLVVPRHIIEIERFVLDALADGDQKLTIEKPIRHGGSVYVSWHFPFWLLGSFPWMNVGIVSHEQGFASSWGAKVRDSMIEFGSSFGVEVSRDFSARSWWEIEKHGGSMRSFGIKAGGMTGRGFDVLIFDDLIKNAADADSETTRDMQWEFLTGTAMGRREPGALLIIMSARWHEDDLIGRIHREQPGEYRRLRLPAIAEEPDEDYPDPDQLGREPGQALWPQRWPLHRLEKRRVEQGEYYFNANFQQRPTSPQGTIFKRTWWKRWSQLPPSFDFSCWSWDMSFKDKESSSFVVGGCWGRIGASFYLRWQVRGQWSFSKTKEMLVASITRPEYSDARSNVFIEDKANGTAIIDDLRATIGGLIPIETGPNSKLARARSITGYVEAGNVFIPEAGTEAALDQDDKAWVAAYINEHAGFPKGAHDDQVDMTSQALREMLKRMGGSVVTQTGQSLPPRG